MERQQAEMFKVLGVESRVRIINLLKERGPLGVNAMAKELGITASAVSQNLRVLRQAGLVRSERKGYWIPYEIDPAALQKCGDLLSEVCACGCRGSGRFQEAQLRQVPGKEKLALLEEYQQELQQELDKVRARIQELKQ